MQALSSKVDNSRDSARAISLLVDDDPHNETDGDDKHYKQGIEDLTSQFHASLPAPGSKAAKAVGEDVMQMEVRQAPQSDQRYLLFVYISVILLPYL